MQKSISLILSMLILVGTSLVLTSCKDDDGPKINPKLSFAEEEMTISENAGTIEIEVILDKAYSRDITIEYDVDGTASEGTSPSSDYEIMGDFGEVVIEAGETIGIIEIKINPDDFFETAETIQLSIEDVDTDGIDITNKDEIEITITNDDDQVLASFVETSRTVKESDGLIEVEVEIEQPLTQDVIIQYTLEGDAVDSLTNSDEYDYFIDGVAGEVIIAAGETKGSIKIQLVSDLDIEDADQNTEPFDPENLIITLTEASLGVGIGTDDEMEILVEQENGLFILLFWPDPDETQVADMDMLLRVGPNTTSWLGVLTGSVFEGNEGPEAIFIPYALPFAAYGLSHTYYDGTLDPLNFEVLFVDFVNGNFEAAENRESFEATYTAVNKNKWTSVTSTKVVQTFEKVGGAFTSPTEITVPDAGSRIGSSNGSTLLNPISRNQKSRIPAKVLKKLTTHK